MGRKMRTPRKMKPTQNHNENRFPGSHLVRNSIYILMNTAFSALFGVLFWMIAVRLYSSDEVGSASAVLSLVGIVISLSSLGMGTSAIRFLPMDPNKNLLFNTMWMTSIAGVLIVGFSSVLAIRVFYPPLTFIFDPAFIVVLFFCIVSFSSVSIMNACLLALRRADYSFVQSLGGGMRLLMLAPLAFAGVLGIVGSYALAFAASLTISFHLLRKVGIRPSPSFDRSTFTQVIRFSIGNYLTDFLLLATAACIPILVLGSVGPEGAAYFAISYSIAGLLYAVPNSVFLSFFIEGSHGNGTRVSLRTSIYLAAAITAPLGAILLLFGGAILSIFSSEYATHATALLRWLAISAGFVILNSMYASVKRVQKDMNPVILVNSIMLISTLVAIYSFSSQYGVDGIGAGWFAGQGISSVAVVALVCRARWRKSL